MKEDQFNGLIGNIASGFIRDKLGGGPAGSIIGDIAGNYIGHSGGGKKIVFKWKTSKKNLSGGGNNVGDLISGLLGKHQGGGGILLYNFNFCI